MPLIIKKLIVAIMVLGPLVGTSYLTYASWVTW
jgi:hypothetical protein